MRFLLLLLLLLASHSALAATAPVDMSALIRGLTAPALEGRRAGEPGGERAAELLEQAFGALALAPLEGFDGLRQPFSFAAETRATTARLAHVLPSGGVRELPRNDWRPLSASSSGFLHTPVLFCAYGISSPTLGWDDYQGVTLAGKSILLVRQVPEGLGDGSAEWREACRLEARVAAARVRGAAAVLVADSPFSERPELERGAGPDPALGDCGLLLAGLSAAAADSLLAPTGQGLRALVSRISRARKASLPLAVPGVLEIEIRQERVERRSCNLGAALPGLGAAARRWVLLCAHFDHLGLGVDGAGPLHPGADDDASGTAMVLAVTQTLRNVLAAAGGERRSLAVVLFGGEELGRLGSRSLLEARPAWVDSLDLVVNLDMVGRLRENTLQVLGGEEHPELEPSLSFAAARAGLVVKACPEAPGGDHESFAQAGVPALMLFTGPHADYHRPTDTVERLNLAGLGPIHVTLAGWLPALLNPGLEVARQDAALPRPDEGAGPVKVAIGIVPGYESSGAGMPVQDVKPGSAAEAAGVRQGDLIVSLGRFPVANIHDYTYALRHFAAGDEVPLALLRNGLRLQLSVRLEERRK